jgi:hypothetical protein
MGKRKVLLALGVGAAALLMLCGLGVLGLWYAARSFSPEPEWVASATPPPGVEKLFGVKIPSTAKGFYERESGFQDPVDELIFELAPDEVPRFLEHNHLSRGESNTADAWSVLKMNGPPRATRLEGLSNEENDAGFVQYYRHCDLWEWPGRTFIYCDAFGT